MQTITFTASRRRHMWLSDAALLASAIGRAIFSDTACLVAVAITAIAMICHLAAIDDTLRAQTAVAMDVLYCLPWLLAYAIRSTRQAIREGGVV